MKKITEKTVKAESLVPASDDTYPEIEKFFPFNPLDFESFDLPEEHQKSKPERVNSLLLKSIVTTMPVLIYYRQFLPNQFNIRQ